MKQPIILIVFTVIMLVTSRAQATSVLISGNSMNQYDTNLTSTIAGLGLTASFVAPSNFASTNLSAFNAVWLDGFSQYGTGWSTNLLAFMNAGGNVLVQNPGFGSEALSIYPLATQLTASYTYPPGENTITIVNTTTPNGANHAVKQD
jgi:hypothetical protein